MKSDQRWSMFGRGVLAGAVAVLCLEADLPAVAQPLVGTPELQAERIPERDAQPIRVKRLDADRLAESLSQGPAEGRRWVF